MARLRHLYIPVDYNFGLPYSVHNRLSHWKVLVPERQRQRRLVPKLERIGHLESGKRVGGQAAWDMAVEWVGQWRHIVADRAKLPVHMAHFGQVVGAIPDVGLKTKNFIKGFY